MSNTVKGSSFRTGGTETRAATMRAALRDLEKVVVAEYRHVTEPWDSSMSPVGGSCSLGKMTMALLNGLYEVEHAERFEESLRYAALQAVYDGTVSFVQYATPMSEHSLYINLFFKVTFVSR